MAKKKSKKRFSWLWIVLTLLGVIILSVVLWVVATIFYFPVGTLGNRGSKHIIDIRKGLTVEEFNIRSGYELGVTNMFVFEKMTEYYLKGNIPSGRYEVNKDITMYEYFKMIRSRRQYPVKLTIHNIRTKQQLLDLVSNKLMMSKEELNDLLTNEKYCSAMGLDTTTIVELIFPDTYQFYWDVSPAKLMDTFKGYYDKFWNKERLAKADSLGLSKNEITIIASIVEEESAKAKEYGKIGRLYINRYKIGMPLQADPTIKFALQDFSLRRILNKHLDFESPYNTYKQVGLPPGPIRLPMKSTIDHILNSEPNGYLYMCAKEDFSGYHNFATSYREHINNAKRYQRELNRRGIK